MLDAGQSNASSFYSCKRRTKSTVDYDRGYYLSKQY